MTSALKLIELGVDSVLAEHMGHQFEEAATAAGNASQGDATLLSESRTIFTTVTASSADSARLPTSDEGRHSSYLVVNLGAGTLNVYPQVDGKINNGSADAGVTIAAGAHKLFLRIGDTHWFSF